jgi:hypothetical protein
MAAEAATLAVSVYYDNSDAGFQACAAAQGASETAVEEARESHPVGVIADYTARAVAENERNAQVCLLRCIFGNPFRPSQPLPASVLAWNSGTVRRLAEGIYEERRMPEGTLDTARLAVLADALLDAGCDDEALMEHCRSAGPHVRGCWAVDMILGKS